VVKRIEPGRAIGVSQWNAVSHFLDVRGRVVIIGIGELPAKLRGEEMADRSLP
jgi:hypothetical protein